MVRGNGKVYAGNPKDQEAAVFYALSLLVSEPQDDKTLANSRKAIEILSRLLEEAPSHPGAAYYLIHAADNPNLAGLGLPAARRYAQIAPAVPHTLHMPSHIFAQMGLWNEMVESNPARSVGAPKQDKHLPGYLDRIQIDLLFQMAEVRALEGAFVDVRNLAILELFYSTGMRLSELQGLSRGDLDLVSQQRIQITSGHPMGGCALGGDAKRDVVDSRGRSWDVDGLYVADSSILPTSLGVNPCYTVYTLGRYIAHKMVDEIRAQG